MDAYDIQTFLASQGGNMPIEYWTCPNCERTNAPGKRTCRCGAPKVEYVTDGERIVVKDAGIADDRKKGWAKKQRKIQSKVKPADDAQGEGFITSTKSWD